MSSWHSPSPTVSVSCDVRLHAVGRVEHRGADAALRPVRVRLVGGALGGHEHAAVRGGLERERQPGDPRSDHEIIRLEHQRATMLSS